MGHSYCSGCVFKQLESQKKFYMRFNKHAMWQCSFSTYKNFLNCQNIYLKTQTDAIGSSTRSRLDQ